MLEFGEFRYLTTGDAETEAEQRMIDEWSADLDADVYQCPDTTGQGRLQLIRFLMSLPRR